MKSFDRLVLIVLVLSVGLILFLLLQGDRVGVQIEAFYPQKGTEISARGKVGVEFDIEMAPDSVEDKFSVVPDVPGDFMWEGNTLWYLPNELLNRGQEYQFTIQAGAESLDGRKLLEAISWSAKVRAPDIVYLVLGASGGDLWRLNLSSGEPIQLTETSGGVFDFAPDPTGEWIVYSLANDLGGRDLWLIDRDGQNPTSFLPCEQDLCSEAVWSVDATWIAYVRETVNEETGLYQRPKVWTAHVQTGDTAPLYDTENAFGHSPSFSPDGKRLASYDIVSNVIRVLNLETSQEAAIPSAYPSVGDWSPDGKAMIFIDIRLSGVEPIIGVYVVDFINQEVSQAFRELAEEIDYSLPRWSPDGDWFAVGLRAVTAGVSKGIWVQNLDASETIKVTDDAAATFSSYRWDPWGDQLVFQRFGLGASDHHPSIWLWDWESGDRHLLVETGARPEWLP